MSYISINSASVALMFPNVDMDMDTAVTISSPQVFDGAIRCVLERNQRKTKKKKGKKNCVIS